MITHKKEIYMSVDTSKLWMISVQDDEDNRWIRSPFNGEIMMRGFINRYINDKRYSELEIFTEETLDIELDVVMDKETNEVKTLKLREILFDTRYQKISDLYHKDEDFRNSLYESKFEVKEESE
jgi:hypothetical protein